MFPPAGAPEPATQNNAPAPEPAANTSPIVVVWYPNESSNTHEEVRAEVGRLIEQATGRKAEHKTTTDYTIAIDYYPAAVLSSIFYMNEKHGIPLPEMVNKATLNPAKAAKRLV